MADILLGLAVNLIWVALGTIGVLTVRLLVEVSPTRRLWRLRDPRTLVICASTSIRTDTGEYYRPATGIGQVRALAITTHSLHRGYRNLDTRNILLSDDQIHGRIENDIILLGGPKNNTFTRRLLDKLKSQPVADQSGSVISWLRPPNQREFVPATSDRLVTTDYGLIVRVRNPFSTSDTTACLFSGGHTYGTIAAARYFAETLFQRARFARGVARNYAAIVRCDVVDGHPVNLHLEVEYEWSTTP